MRPFTRFISAAAACLVATGAGAAAPQLHGYYASQKTNRVVDAPAGVRTVTQGLPTWTYSVKAGADLGGGSYSGVIMGADPSSPTKGTTSIPTQIVPLIITINDGNSTVTYDSTKADACPGSNGHNAYYNVRYSPIFTPGHDWVMNGVNVGASQYIDAFQRAEFWSKVHGTAYHLSLNVSTLPVQHMVFTGASKGTNNDATQYGGCGSIGVINQSDMDARIQALILGPLKTMINAGTFPIFLTKSVVMADPGVSLTSNCCILGYHGSMMVGGKLQVYSPFSFDSTGVFGGDVSTLSHEMAEAVNDPTGSNPTPTWGNIGQQPGCQNNFEVGDPLSPGGQSPTNSFTVAAPNGITYHMQELAFFSWYYGGVSLGAGGGFSDNGTFKGDAILCSKGGGTH